MTSITRIGSITVAASVAVLLGACDDDRPTRISPPAPSPVSTALLSLLISGPDSVPPGTSARFTALARYGDGSTRDVTSAATWRSSNTAVLAVSLDGSATGGDRGEASITAAFEGFTVVKTAIMVLPAGTFRLIGTVRDSGYAIPGVKVMANGADGPTLTATTDAAAGAYRVYGVAGNVQVTATKEGYAPASKLVQVQSHQSLDIDLVPAGPRDRVEGVYRLTVTAAETCTALPPEVRSRTYTAILTQDAAQVFVRLEDAQFAPDGGGQLNRFSGTAQPNELRLRLAPPFAGDYVFYSPEVMEVVSASPLIRLALIGEVSARATADGYSGPLSGVFQLWSGFQRTTECRSADHRFELTRRPQ